MTSNATYSRTITVDLPDFASKSLAFTLLTSVAIDAANNEVFPRKEYSLTLDGSGTGSIALPCPDNSGDAAWAWRVELPDGRDVTTTMAYAGTSLDLSDWLTAEATTETASTIQALVSGKADKVTGATADNLASLDANGNLQDSGYGVIDEDSMASDSATDVPTQQSVKAYVDAQIGTVDDVSELTTTTGASTNMLRVAAAGGLEYRTTAQVLGDIGAEASGAAATVQGNLDSHTGNTSNPHSVSAAQVGAYTTAQTDSAIDTDIGTHAALTSSVHGISVFGATLVDDADAATARGTLGLGSAAVEDASAFDAAGSAAAAQAASQPVDADLTAIAGLDNSDSNFIVGSATGWVAESGATVRASLGLGSAAVEDASAFDAAGAAAAAISDLGGAGATLSDEKLRGWAAELPQLMTSVIRTNYSDGIEFGWIQVTGTVTWPDGSTGHVDGVEYPDDLGRLQYFTASHETSGKIAVQSPLIDGAAGITIVTPDYYVDSAASAGGDGSLTTPFDTLSDLSGLGSGDVVALKSGSTFSETLTAVAGVSYYRYGAGAKPIIDAGQTISGTWIQDGTYTNTWYQDVTIELHATKSYVNLLADGVMATRAASVAALNSASGQFYATPDTGSGDTTVRIHIHPGGADPNASGVVYRCPRRLYSIAGDGVDDLTLDGLTGQLQSMNDGSIVLGSSATVRHSVAKYGSAHNMFAGEGATIKACIFDEAQYSVSTASLLVIYTATASGLDVAIADCYVHMTTYDTDFSGVYGHTTSGTMGDVTLSRCKSDNVAIAYDMTDSASFTVSKCIANDSRLVFGGNMSMTVDGLSAIHTAAHANRIVSVNGAYTVSLKRMYIDATGTSVDGLVYSNAAMTLTMQYCQIKGSAGRTIYFGSGAASGTFNHYDNNVLGSGWNHRIYSVSTTTINSNRNIWDNEAGNFVSYNGTNYTTLAAWQTASGGDVASSIGGADGSKVPA